MEKYEDKQATDLRSEAERKWDEKADLFNEYQKNSDSPISKMIVDYLESMGLLKDTEILDIGGGSGRYALPFAKRAKRVTMTDISSKMLAHARNNAVEESLTNLSYEKLDWEQADLLSLGWERSFDLVFASMCPALRTEEGLEKMIAASKGHCFINQFIRDYDSVGAFFEKRLEIKREFDPHNDRENAARFFNFLWEKGFDPQIRYAVDEFEKQMSKEEVLAIVSRDYGERANEKGVRVETLLSEYQQGSSSEVVTVTGKTVSMMILWQV